MRVDDSGGEDRPSVRVGPAGLCCGAGEGGQGTIRRASGMALQDPGTRKLSWVWVRPDVS